MIYRASRSVHRIPTVHETKGKRYVNVPTAALRCTLVVAKGSSRRRSETVELSRLESLRSSFARSRHGILIFRRVASLTPVSAGAINARCWFEWSDYWRCVTVSLLCWGVWVPSLYQLTKREVHILAHSLASPSNIILEGQKRSENAPCNTSRDEHRQEGGREGGLFCVTRHCILRHVGPVTT